MKYYEKILTNTRRFFGLDSEASEAEVDQKLEEAGTEEAFKASIKASIEADMQRKLEEATTLKESLESVNQEQADKINTLQNDLQSANQKVSEMQSKIEELEKKPADDHTQGVTKEQGPEKAPIWMSNPVNQKVAKMKFAQKTTEEK